VSGERRAFLGLGSNLGDRLGLLRRGVELLGAGGDVAAVSSVYETEPVGGPEQGRFLNLVVELETNDPARRLLERCFELEADAARVRTVRFGPRTLDADVLYIDGERVANADLVVPHPGCGSDGSSSHPWPSSPPTSWTPQPWPLLVVRSRSWVHSDQLLLKATGTHWGWNAEGGQVQRTVRIIGPGRAGRSLAIALERAGWQTSLMGRAERHMAAGVDAVVIATPDDAVADVAAALDPTPPSLWSTSRDRSASTCWRRTSDGGRFTAHAAARPRHRRRPAGLGHHVRRGR